MKTKFNSTQVLSRTLSRAKLREESKTYRPSIQVIEDNSVYSQPITINLLKQSFLQKSLQLTNMVATVHNFLLSVDELKWILHQSYKIIENYQQKTMPFQNISHKIQIENIQKEFKKLIERFSQIQGSTIQSIAHSCHEQIIIPKIHKNTSLNSFKMTETQTKKDKQQEKDPSEQFSKIELNRQSEPLLHQNERIKQSDYKKQISHFQQALQISSEELKKAQESKILLIQKLELENQHLQQKLKNWQQKWNGYRMFAKTVIGKLKYKLKHMNEENSSQNKDLNAYYMSNVSQSNHKKEVETIWTQLCDWENQLLEVDKTVKPQNLSGQKNAKMRQIVNLRMEIEYLNRQKNQITQKRLNKPALDPVSKQLNEQTIKMLLMQALTIQQLVQIQ